MPSSETCDHPNTGTHPHIGSDGSQRQVIYCLSCGMEW